MWYWKFKRACKKYCCSFTLDSNLQSVILILYPYETYDTIELSEGRLCYNKLFKRAIKELKKYYGY